MSEELFINTIRYLNELFRENKLSPDQIAALASFVLEVTELPCEQKEHAAMSKKVLEALQKDSSGVLQEKPPARDYFTPNNGLNKLP